MESKKKVEIKKENENEFNGEFHIYTPEGKLLDTYSIEKWDLVKYPIKKRLVKPYNPNKNPTLYNGNSGSSLPDRNIYYDNGDMPEVVVRGRRNRPQGDPFEHDPFGSPFMGGSGMSFGMQQAEMMHMQMRQMQMHRYHMMMVEAAEQAEREAEAERSFNFRKNKNLSLLDKIFEGVKQEKFAQSRFTFGKRHLDSNIYSFGIRAFAPFDMFGGGYYGDGKDRKFDLSSEASARIHQNIYLDTKTYKVFTNAWAQETRHESKLPKTAIPNSTIIEALKVEAQNGAEVFTFATHVEAGNPILKSEPNIRSFFVPDIDVFAFISLKKDIDNNEIVINGKLTGDNFPSTEFFIKDASGKAVFLGIGFYEKIGLKALFGTNKNRKIMSFDGLRIKQNSEGKFTHIKSKEMEEFISISEWNKPFLEANPHKNDPNRIIESGDICVVM